MNGVGSQYSSHYVRTWCIQHYYRWCVHLSCPQLNEVMPHPADLNGLVRFAERRNLVSACVPSHFKCSLKLYLFSTNHITVYKPGNTIPIYSHITTCLSPFETDLLKRQTMLVYTQCMCLFKKIYIYQCWYRWLTIFECKSFTGSQNDCQAHHHSSMQFNWWNDELFIMHGCSVSIQPSALHFSYCPMASLNYFFCLCEASTGVGKVVCFSTNSRYLYSG